MRAMGSVRRATWRQYLPYLGLNVLVSAITVVIVLSIWGGRRQTPPAAPPTPTLNVVARVASVVPTATVTIIPSPTPVTYRVQPGDTLYAIAVELDVPLDALMAANGLTNPDTLDVGQVLVVPQLENDSTPVPTSAPAPLPATVTPDAAQEAPRVEIRGVDGAGDLEREAVRLLNTGGVARMAGWTLDDGQGNIYRFPEFTLHSGAASVHTRAGTDTVIDLYWGLDQAVWTPGKVITLRDASGAVQSTFRIPEN